MTMVLAPGDSLDEQIASGVACPACGGRLRKWGSARWRVVRAFSSEKWLRPGRVRCSDCGVTQVVLPAEVLVRRRDAVAVVGRAWRFFAGGMGPRRVAGQLGVPMETVRRWLQRLRGRARVMHGQPRRGEGDYLDRALSRVVSQAAAAGWHQEDDLWRFVAYQTQGKLLSNTS